MATLKQRFWAKVALPTAATDCMLWTAAKKPNGYGTFTHDKKHLYAHRLAYELAVGPIPEGLQIDHLCRTRACVRPDHLEPVTQQENLRRGEAGICQREKTHCPAGHEYAGDNVRIYIRARGTVNRACRACEHERWEQRKRKAKMLTGGIF